MSRWQKNLTALWVGCFLTSASYSMVVPFLPLFLVDLGVRRHVEVWSGLLFSVSYLAGALVAPYWGRLSDRYGRRPMILRAGFALTGVYLATAFVRTPEELLALRIVQGLMAGYIPAAIALVGTNTPEERVGYALSLLSTASSAGGIVGPLLGGVISHLVGYPASFAAAGGVVFLAAVVALALVVEEDFRPHRAPTSFFGDLGLAVHNRRLLAVVWLMLLTSFATMTVEPILPLYILRLGGNLRDASLLAGIAFSVAGVATVLCAPFWGRLGDRVGFRRTLVAGLAGGGLGTLLQIPFHSIVAFTAVRFLYGAFFCGVYPAMNGLVVQATPPDFRGRAFGLTQSANQVGTMLGPLVGGWVGGAFGIHQVFWLTGALLLVVALVSWRRPRLVAAMGRG
jgi:DHA1 family multidrug resistance protein-like MFS transporter